MSNLVKSHIYDPDGHWGTSQFDAAALTTPITVVHFCAHANETNEGSDGQPPTNHWSLFLETGPTSSVCVDTVPSGPYEPGMLLLEPHTYNTAEDCLHDVAAALPPGMTVADVLQVLIAKKRDRYVFAPVGEGCRHWLFVIVADFAEAGLVEAEFLENTRWALARYWRYPSTSGESEPRTIAVGTFF